jgi:hypothetical protein
VLSRLLLQLTGFNKSLQEVVSNGLADFLSNIKLDMCPLVLDEVFCEAHMVFAVLTSNTLLFLCADNLEDIYQLFPKDIYISVILN